MTAADLATPTVPAGDLDEFRLLRPLGRGGMGAVFLGHDTVLDRLVAIKLIGVRDPGVASRERFLIEARAIARLSHPNVVAIYRVGTTRDGRPYLVQELIRGTSLDRVARPLPWRRVCEIGIGVARGLAAAHRRGILHRDVKPANVMIDEAGTARLLDFGLAKLTADAPHEATVARATTTLEGDDPETTAEARSDAPARTPSDVSPDAPPSIDATGETPAVDQVLGSVMAAFASPAQATPRGAAQVVSATAPGALVGTPRYAAPEIWRGDLATPRSDLYSLGALLYELASGGAPHRQMLLPELRRAVLEDGARRLVDVAPEIPVALGIVVDRCLACRPDQRPDSADEVAHDLELLLTEAPALPEGNPYRGLRAFDAEHRGFFFGRGADVSALVDRLRTEPLLAVAGDSGIGKSSVCRAGVIPAVRGGALTDTRHWRAITVVPGRRPFTALCDAIGATAAQRDLPASELLRALRPGPEHGILLFVDQLEELITLADPDEAHRAAELLAAVGDGALGIKALLSVRGDFLTRVAALPALGPPLTRGLHLLRVLTASDLREAVIGPARAKGVRFESEAMVSSLVAAVADTAGALPLLQFALAELWTARDAERGCIPGAALEQLGGVAGGLARHADAVLLALGTAERATARRILVRLVSAEGTRAVRDAAELGAGDPVAAAALEALVRGRLVVARDTADGDPAYELAHEALIAGWGHLREWLDDDAGHRALRERLAAAAAAWQRLGRRPDLLWSPSQLAEARGVDALAALEADFLAASQRLTQRRRIVRGALLLSIPTVALATWLTVRSQAEAERDREVAARQTAALAHRRAGADRAAAATRDRSTALASFAAGDLGAAEATWAEARQHARAARAAYRDAAAQLEAALQINGARADLRAAMADVMFDHAVVAEAERDTDGAAELVRRLEAYDPVRARDLWHRPATLSIDAGADVRVTVSAYRDEAGHLRLGPTLATGRARLERTLPPGAYQIELVAPDGLEVRHPVLLTRGERLPVSLRLPPRTAVPAGYIYVAPGRFLTGSDHDDSFRRDFLHAAPLHQGETDAFLIARHEVTLDDWMTYLRALPAAERAARRPETRGGSMVMALSEDAMGRFSLTLQPSTVVYRAAQGGPLTYPGRSRRQSVRWERLPVSGVSWDDAQAYAAWLAAGHVPGARLCREREWERAARGADGRRYPHGAAIEPDDANFDVTYGRRPLGYGPDEVGSHPASDSPFGIADMTGNVWEWVIGDGDTPVVRGGSWYHGSSSALTMNRDLTERSMREIFSGLRICADAPPAR